MSEAWNTFIAIIGKDLYNFSLERLKFPPNTPLKKPEVELNPRYILQNHEPPLPLILSYQNVKRFFYKTFYTTSSAQIYYFNSDHICVLDHDSMRCKICGISLKWSYMADNFQMKILNMDFFPYENLESDIIFFKDLKNFTTIRKYMSYIVERPLGIGFEDLYNKNFKFPVELLNELGGPEKFQTQSNEFFKILADFESSNLHGYKIIKENNNTYSLRLLMKGDTNSLENGYTQWFFFKIISKKPVTFTFEIINYRKKMVNLEIDKSNTLAFYDFEPEGVNKVWNFMEENVKYIKNPEIIPQNELFPQDLYTLKFHYKFETHKEVLFSFTYPYTFTNLIEFLTKQEKKLFIKGIKEQEFDYKSKEILLENELISYNRIVLGSTICGLPLILLQITSSKYQDPDLFFPSKYREKKYIIIIARQHPGEPPSSYVAEGIISFLLSEDPSAQILRTFFIFLIIPMMNPDGVILGNNRTGFKGSDFNRNWKSPNKETEPEVVLVKNYIEDLIKNEKKIQMFFDLHGHSHKKGVFVYSTPPSFLKDWEVNEDGMFEWAKTSFFTNILQNSCKYLCLENCKSKFGKGIDESARMVMCKDFEIQYSYTIETSFSCYFDKRNGEVKRFKIDDFKTLAKDLMIGVLEFNMILSEIEYSKNARTKTETTENHFNKFLAKLKKSYPDFKENWRDYYSEPQLQHIFNKLEKFVEIVNESLFPTEKESPSMGKPIDAAPSANEHALKEFYESNLFDGSNGLSPYIISNSSSFSTNKDFEEEQNNEIERQENKKILSMMLFHEKDLKKTEKLLKKKALKKVQLDKQNNNTPNLPSASPKKKVSSGSMLFQHSPISMQKSGFLEKKTSKRTLVEIGKKKESFKTKDNEHLWRKDPNPLNNKGELLNEKEISKDREFSNDSYRIKDLSKDKDYLKDFLKDTEISHENKDYVKNREFSKQESLKLKDYIAAKSKEYLKANNKEYLTEKEKEYIASTYKDFVSINEKEFVSSAKGKTPLRPSLQISTGTGLTYNTTASTPQGNNTAHSRFISSKEKNKIQDFFEETESTSNNLWEQSNLKEMDSSKLRELGSAYVRNPLNLKDLKKNSESNLNRRTKTKDITTVEITEVNIPEEETDRRNKRKTLTIKNRPKTATNLTKLVKNGINQDWKVESREKNRDLSHKRGFSNDQEGRYRDYSKELSQDSVSNYFMGMGIIGKNPTKTRTQNSFCERFCKNKKSSKKMLINPFLKTKKDIYILYSFKKPVIMVSDWNKTKTKMLTTFNETTQNFNKDENEEKMKYSISESEDKKSKKPQNINYKAFHIVRKSYL